VHISVSDGFENLLESLTTLITITGCFIKEISSPARQCSTFKGLFKIVLKNSRW
jgi:hypothetical protein